MSESAKVSTTSDVEDRVLEREDLVERIGRGDAGALGELFEHATGAEVKSVKAEAGQLCRPSRPERVRPNPHAEHVA